MKKFLLIIFILSSICIIHSQTKSNSYDILGSWLVEKGDSIIEIYKENGIFYGKITWLKNPYNDSGEYNLDENNPDPKLQDRPILGLILIFGFEFKDGYWQKPRLPDGQR